MTQTCPSCNSAVDESARFCTECGFRMDAEPAPAEAPSTPPPAPAAPPAPPAPASAPPAQPPVYSAAPGHGQPPGYGTPAGRKEAPGLIPYHNQPALVGYYLSVFSLIPCLGLPLGIAAVVLGAIGLRKHREDPSRKGKGHALTALILGGITTLAWGAILVFMVVAASQG